MANYSDSIERELSGVKDSLGRQLSAAEDKARAVADWRTHYQRNPVPMLLGAAAIGFIASAMLDDDDHEGDGSRSMSGSGASAVMAPLRASIQSPQVNDAFHHLLDSFVAAASVKVADYVEQWIPGFRQEFSKRHS